MTQLARLRHHLRIWLVNFCDVYDLCYQNDDFDWTLSFQHLNDDTNSQETSLQASQKKAHQIKFLTEEIPTIEYMKKDVMTYTRIGIVLCVKIKKKLSITCLLV